MKKLILLFSLVSNMILAQAGDCPALCVTSDIVGTTAVDGLTDELNTTNGNCLSANEASSSYWYQVCFSSSGTFSFTMNPSGNKNDFDFALWTGTACPPTNAPVRCSFAGIFPFGGASDDLTGLGNGATDNTEAAAGDGWLAPLNVANGSCITLNINNFGSGSDVFDLDFTGTATMTCVGTLPVTLVNFNSIIYKKDVVELKWTTSSEQNNDYFTIEKSYDGLTFEVLKNIKASGNSSNEVDYICFDSNLKNDIIYYRLKQTDYDGVSKILRYSYVKLVEHSNVTIINIFGNILYNGIPKEDYNLLPGVYLINGKKIIIE